MSQGYLHAAEAQRSSATYPKSLSLESPSLAEQTHSLTTPVLGSLPSTLTLAQSLRFGVPRQTLFPGPPRGTHTPSAPAPTAPNGHQGSPRSLGSDSSGSPPYPSPQPRMEGRSATRETDPAAWGRGTREGACPEGSIWPPTHLGVTELHHHVLAAPSRRHLLHPTAPTPGFRVPHPANSRSWAR